jgi:hypothetical protein
MMTHAVKNFIRNRDFFKIISSLETGADHGMWSFQRYRTWLDSRKNWSIPEASVEPPDDEPNEPPPLAPVSAPAAATGPKAPKEDKPPQPAEPKRSGRIEIEPTESEFGRILKRPGEHP